MNKKTYEKWKMRLDMMKEKKKMKVMMKNEKKNIKKEKRKMKRTVGVGGLASEKRTTIMDLPDETSREDLNSQKDTRTSGSVAYDNCEQALEFNP
ncbi:unnamed protein product [Microthlaspi erraticum]|uniref:Uncharacterized protein n=1 Tax=Microthlaspi erraticum TaxID=1685480 RepID=A0A6D2IZ14_9BRAS|nr:unnamed protein product [Microthlaspi erraticum]